MLWPTSAAASLGDQFPQGIDIDDTRTNWSPMTKAGVPRTPAANACGIGMRHPMEFFVVQHATSGQADATK